MCVCVGVGESSGNPRIMPRIEQTSTELKENVSMQTKTQHVEMEKLRIRKPGLLGKYLPEHQRCVPGPNEDELRCGVVDGRTTRALLPAANGLMATHIDP